MESHLPKSSADSCSDPALILDLARTFESISFSSALLISSHWGMFPEIALIS